MKLLHFSTTSLLYLSTLGLAQTIAPSNSTQDVQPRDTSPRFFITAANISFSVAPLSVYASMSHDQFLSLDASGNLLNVGDSNANNLSGMTFSYISCDPEDYAGVLDAGDVVRTVADSQQQQTSIILYSRHSNHCSATQLRGLPYVNGIFTTLDPVVATSIYNKLVSAGSSGIRARILPDKDSYTNYQGGQSGWSGSPSGTTAVAMIVLYTITGLITALFVIIIITGAVRAHRHPERYGPRNIAGRPRQSRAKGIARAMLETLPIVKFGDHPDRATKPTDSELEMNASPAIDTSANEPTSRTTEKSIAATAIASETETSESTSKELRNPDGSDDRGQLGCSICTEDFTQGEEVRVLPCNHKFHPECVDPWLLNVSGTCPLCRIDLRPKEEQQTDSATAETQNASTDAPGATPSRRVSILDGGFAPPLGPIPSRFSRSNISTRRDTIYNLRQTAGGTREERIAALRRFRQQRRNRNSIAEGDTPDEEERRGLTTRLRERFRVRTRTLGEESGTGTTQSAVSSPTQTGHRSSITTPAPTWTT